MKRLLWLVAILGWLTACGAPAAPSAATPAASANPVPAVTVTPSPTAAPAQPTPTPSGTPTATLVPATATVINTPRPPTPTSTPRPPTATPTVTPTIVYYPIGEKPWPKVPTILIAAAKDDERIQLVHNAVDHWNQIFKDMGSPFRMGAINVTTDQIPGAYLKAIGDANNPGGADIPQLAQTVRAMHGDLIVALANEADFVSVTKGFGQQKLIAIQSKPGGMTAPIVVENIIAHEMGHANGLGHNDDPTKLMCGRPAPCRPDATWLSLTGFLPVTDVEKAYLLKIYPTGWKPAP